MMVVKHQSLPDAVLDVQLCRCAKVPIFICMWIPVVVTDYCFWYSMVVVQLSTRYRPISADNETHIQALSRPWWSLGASSVALSFTSLDSWSEPRAMVNQNGDVAICCHGFIIMLTRIFTTLYTYTILCILYKEILRIFMHRNHSNMIKHIFCCCGVVHPKWTLTSLRGCAVCRKRCGRTYAVWSNLLGIWNIQIQVSLVFTDHHFQRWRWLTPHVCSWHGLVKVSVQICEKSPEWIVVEDSSPILGFCVQMCLNGLLQDPFGSFGCHVLFNPTWGDDPKNWMITCWREWLSACGLILPSWFRRWGRCSYCIDALKVRLV
jgi:hypothetical protein